MFGFRIRGESPPLPPRTFGRDELTENIVNLAQKFIPIALIGTGGIGKTFVALAVLHHDRIEEQFDDDRGFVRCYQFPTFRAHFHCLSDPICVGVENFEDTTVPILKEAYNPRPAGSGCSRDLCRSGGTDSVQQYLHLYHFPYHHYSLRLQVPRCPNAVDRCCMRYLLPELRQQRSVEPCQRHPRTTQLSSTFNHLTRHS